VKPEETRQFKKEIVCPNCGAKGKINVAKGDKALFSCNEGCRGIFEVSTTGVISRSILKKITFRRSSMIYESVNGEVIENNCKGTDYEEQ